MLPTLALTAMLSLAPAQNAPLALTNERLTLGGPFGPTRANNRLLAGDILYLAFDIENLKRDAVGKVRYSVGMEITDSAGKSIFSAKPADQESILPFGGDKLPSRGYFGIPLHQAKGTYNCRMTVTDHATKATKTVDKSFEILPPSFGIVRLSATVDEDGGIPTPFRGTEGQPFVVTFFVVGFARDAKTKQPNTAAEIRVYDQNGKPTNDKPLVYTWDKGTDEKDDMLKFPIPLPMNQAGTFTVEIKADCKISGSSDTVKFPVKILPVEK